MTWLPAHTETAKHDLIVWLKTEPKLEVTLEYNTALFQTATIRGLLDNYVRILQTMVNDPGRRIGSVSSAKSKRTVRSPHGFTFAKPKVHAALRNSTMPRDKVEAQLAELWEAAFKRRPIGIHQNFFELGGDSLLAAQLFAQIEKRFHLDLPLALLLEAPTISQLGRIISQGRVAPTNSSLVPIQTSGTKPPLFCVHGHMGEVFYCRNLSRSLGPDQPLYGLRSQGLGGELPHETIDDMAAHYLEEVRKVQPQGPYQLSGFCLGGMVAFEMARLLNAQGEDVALLVLFNAPAPGGLKGWPLNRIYLTKRVTHELKKLRKLPLGQKLTIFLTKTSAFVSLLSGLFKAAVWQAFRSWSIKGVERGARPLLSVADINVSAAKRYHPGAYAGRVTLFLTEEVASLYATDPVEGWRSVAEGGIDVHDVAGDNNSMFDARFIGALAEKLHACIVRAKEERELAAAAFEFHRGAPVKGAALVSSQNI